MFLMVSIAEWYLKSFAFSLSFPIQIRDAQKTTIFEKVLVLFTSFLELTSWQQIFGTDGIVWEKYA